MVLEKSAQWAERLVAAAALYGAEAWAGIAARLQRLSQPWGQSAVFTLTHSLSGALGGLTLGVAGRTLGRVDLEFAAAAWLLTALGLALIGARPERLPLARSLSAMSLGVLAAILCAVSGGIASPFLSWLILPPILAMSAGLRWAVPAAIAGSLLAFSSLLAAGAAGLLPPSALPADLSVLAGLLAALAALTGIASAMLDRKPDRTARAGEILHQRREAARVANLAPDLIVRIAVGGRLTYVSKASEAMLGLSPEELMGLTPSLWVHIADLAEVETALERTGAAPARLRFRARRRDGSFLWVEMTALRDTKGQITAVVRDFTEQRQHETGLVDARERAEEASKSKSRFLASMSHELRTPLNAIIGFSDMIQQEVYGAVGNARYLEYAKLIHSSGQHLVDMISDLLDMSKIEAGKFKLSLKPVAMAPLVHETMEMVRLAADEAGVALHAQIAEGIGEPLADRRALKQILLNLLSNAIKFTPAQGRVNVTVTRDGETIRMAVRDTGVGIPEGDLARIGKPFEQAGDDLIRSNQKGTGLGLSLVRALAEMHGGTMHLESAPGDGTLVFVTIPMEAQDGGTDETIIYPDRFRAVSKG